MTKPGKIRPLALAIILDQDRILLNEGYDAVRDQTFYRPLGGGIEFGETGAAAVARELREEIGAELADVRYRGALENIFTYNGQHGHEIVLLYTATLGDSALYQRERIEAAEAGADFAVRWMPLADFAPGRSPLYPDGLFDLISALAEQKGQEP